jgi:hypothetical protein
VYVDPHGNHWAEEYGEIPPALEARADLRSAASELLTQAMPGKVVEGGDRLAAFRGVMAELIAGRLTLEEAYAETEHRLPRATSPHGTNNRVFASGWGERLVRTQLSRLYNQAVLTQLLSSGEPRCYVPHSRAEKPESQCSRLLAGQEHDAAVLLERLIQCYTMENWTREVKVPDHPHCTHVITPPRT